MIKPVKCRVQKYDPSVTEPPYQFITLSEFTCEGRDNDDEGGWYFALRLKEECMKQGYIFKFYSLSRHEDYDFDVIVVEP